MYYLYVDNNKNKILCSLNHNKVLKEASYIAKSCVEVGVIKNLRITKNEEEYINERNNRNNKSIKK